MTESLSSKIVDKAKEVWTALTTDASEARCYIDRPDASRENPIDAEAHCVLTTPERRAAARAAIDALFSKQQ